MLHYFYLALSGLLDMHIKMRDHSKHTMCKQSHALLQTPSGKQTKLQAGDRPTKTSAGQLHHAANAGLVAYHWHLCLLACCFGFD